MSNIQEKQSKTDIIMDEGPLENRKLNISVNGIGRLLPALHAEWMMTKEWVTYSPPPDPDTDLLIPGVKEAWTQHCQLVVDDLLSLQRAPYNVFWSQQLFDRSLRRTISTLLKRLPRPFDLDAEYPDRDIQGWMNRLTDILFRVIVRMSTYKENNRDYMTPEYFGQAVYDNFLFDMPRILDFCSLYYQGNEKLVEKVLASLFKHQPKYLDDLKSVSISVMEAFSAVTQKVVDFLASISRQEIGSGTSEFEDLVIYAVDLSYSMAALFQAHPQCSRYFGGHSDDLEFTVQLAAFYHQALHQIHDQLCDDLDLGNVESVQAESLLSRILLAKSKVLLIVRTTVMSCILTPLIENSISANAGDEDFLHLYTGYLSEPSFFTDYLAMFPLDDDIEVFKQRHISIDPMRIQYLKNGLEIPKASSYTAPCAEAAATAIPEMKEATICDDKHNQSVTHIISLFPQLGKGFVSLLLEYFDSDAEKAINALLEDNLPPHLMSLDRTMPERQEKRSEVQIPDVVPTESKDDANNEVIADFNINQLHRGKKKIAKNANALLDDKSDLAMMKDRFAELSIVHDDIYLPVEDAEYDDEYDDTYDDNILGQAEPDGLELGREFVLPRALGGGHISAQSNNQKLDDDDDDEAGDEGAKMNFVRNPAEIREEAERRRQSKQAHMKKKGYDQPRDVVGKAKGQGQDKQVLINRARKNANKNKNHRALADKKQSKGMF